MPTDLISRSKRWNHIHSFVARSLDRVKMKSLIKTDMEQRADTK